MKKISIEELNVNPYTLFAKKWALLTSGNLENYNTMTISWGHLGSLWGDFGGKPTAIVYVRPERYTKKFMDENEYFTICFFKEEYRKDLSYLGSHSGKDEDKVSKTKLSVIESDNTVIFKEAELVLKCRKLFAQDIKEEGFFDKNVIKNCYPDYDFHTLYIGEIIEVLVD